MEDLTTSAGAYSKDELAAMCRHPVVIAIEGIFELKTSVDSLINDPSKTRDYIHGEVRHRFDDMTAIWGKLGPTRAMARRLYPHYEMMFDILDKSLAVNDAIEDLRNGREFIKNGECKKDCCRKLLA